MLKVEGSNPGVFISIFCSDMKWNPMANGRRRWLKAQTLNLDEDLAGSGLMSERDHLNIEKMTALFVVMPIHYLYVEM